MPNIGLILGTGWGDTLKIKDEVNQMRRSEFYNLDVLPGHDRRLVSGTCGGKKVVAWRGRVHMNEDPHLVRDQVEQLIELGVKKIILTAAVGSLRLNYMPGDLVLIDGFVSLFAPPMGFLRTGEFCSPEDIIDRKIFTKIEIHADTDLKIWRGGHAMVRGPQFEGRIYDKPLLRSTGASVVGMSIYPEACVASLYPGVKIIPIGFVTNSAIEVHSHDENQRRVKEVSRKLSGFLEKIIQIL